MADLHGMDRRNLETLLGMSSGYVLDFTGDSFARFFARYRIQIDAVQYRTGSTSKANRMRTFWKKDDNRVVGRVIDGLIAYGTAECCLPEDALLINACRAIARRLKQHAGNLSCAATLRDRVPLLCPSDAG